MTTRALAPAEIAHAATLAALLEASAPKPGNVGPEHAFADMGYEDFLRSAVAIGPALGAAGRRAGGVGATVLRAIRDTRRHVAVNTNLGIVLLFAPLARAAGVEGGELRTRLAQVLSDLTVEDAVAVYAAIRLANPGGLGDVAEQDVRGAPTVTLRQAMALAADRDSIAREYVTAHAITFDIGLPALTRTLAAGGSLRSAATEAFLAMLAEVPDTLIARKCGEATARSVSRRVAEVVAAGPAGSAERVRALTALDASLRDPGHMMNPGTTADLTAAVLFVRLLEQGFSEQE